jgi:hypothetical protein
MDQDVRDLINLKEHISLDGVLKLEPLNQMFRTVN